jgi:EmrB/QacA subfamily drug resistance transporter
MCPPEEQVWEEPGMGAAPVAPAQERIDYATVLSIRTKWVVLVGVLMGLFVAALDQTIVATALPAIIADLRGIDLLAWVPAGYLVASTTTVPIYGRLSDLYGRRSIVLAGLLIFLAGSALCGIATSMMQLILFRVLQGIGAAALTSSAFAVIADLFVSADRPRYQGLFGGVFALASVVGPYLGGVLTDHISWRWVFYVNLPIGLVAVTFIIARMPRLHSGLRASVDWTGTALLIASVVPLLLGLTVDKRLYPWSSPLVLALFAIAGVATVLLLVVESRVSSPVIPLELFRNRTFAVVSTTSVLVGASFFAAIFFISIFMVNVVGVSATAAGSTLMPLTLSLVAGAVTSSLIVQRLGRYRRIIVAGFAVALTGFGLLATLGTTATRWDVTWRMMVLGAGLGPAMPLLNLVVQNAVPFEKVGVATASRQFFLQIGSVVGTAIFGVMLSTGLTAQLARTTAPLLAQLAPSVRAAINLDHLRSGAVWASPTGGAVPTALREAVRQAYAVSITRIYTYAALVLAAAQLVVLALPEIPLRRSNRPDTAPPSG